MSSSESRLLKGKRATVEVTFDPERKPKKMPEIRNSSLRGYSSCLHILRKRRRWAQEGMELAESITKSQEGAFVALLGTQGPNEPLVLIQADHDTRGSNTFYPSVHGDSHGIWLDFYFRTIFTAIAKADEAWGSSELTLIHPTNSAWDPALLTVALEAIGHLTDQRDLSVQQIHIGCIHGVTGKDFNEAVERLNREQSAEDSPTFDEFEVEEIDHSFSGFLLPPDARLFRIPVARTD